jgi:membrane-associated phospholipid phosphatase
MKFAHLADHRRWYNCCWAVYAPESVFQLALVINYFFNVIALSTSLEIVLIVLFCLDLPDTTQLTAKLMEIHHLFLPPMTTIVGFYLIFRQRRPGQTLVNGQWVNIGSYYGMPSGDAMFAGICAGLLHTQKYGIAIGISLILLVSLSRTVLGYHSIAQVAVGSSIGIVIHFLKALLNPVHFFWGNGLLAFFLPLLAFFDRDLIANSPRDYNHLPYWVFVDAGYLVFDFCYCLPSDSWFACLIPAGVRLGLACALVLGCHGTYQYCVDHAVEFGS